MRAFSQQVFEPSTDNIVQGLTGPRSYSDLFWVG